MKNLFVIVISMFLFSNAYAYNAEVVKVQCGTDKEPNLEVKVITDLSKNTTFLSVKAEGDAEPTNYPIWGNKIDANEDDSRRYVSGDDVRLQAFNSEIVEKDSYSTFILFDRKSGDVNGYEMVCTFDPPSSLK